MSRFNERKEELIDALIGIQGRGRSASPLQLDEVEKAVKSLESSEGVSDPTGSSLIEGRWQLMFITRPGTASPIQRTFVGVDFFSVFQEINRRTNDPRVSNIVVCSDAVGELKVEAAATIKDGRRILFQFDRAAFSFKFLPLKVPYRLPFRLLGDAAKGWLDTTYLSETGNLCIYRGNKGTTFVLQKITEPRQMLLSAISAGKGVREAIDEFISSKEVADDFDLVEGEWNMVWSSQMTVKLVECGREDRIMKFCLALAHRLSSCHESDNLCCLHNLLIHENLRVKCRVQIETDSWTENAANGLLGKQVIRKNGHIKFVVDILLGLRFSMNGSFT